MNEPADWTPEFPGQRPPFERGNVVALKHGAMSRRIYEPMAAEIVEGVLSERPELDRYGYAVRHWAENEARAELLRKHIAHHGLLDEDDQPRDSILKWLHRFERAADTARRRLGLDPGSHADLIRAQVEIQRAATDLQSVRDRGRQLMSDTAIEAEVVDDER